ncbi:MAG: 3',5'-cyclic-nucleotide phosphodiesterase [Nevskia sp.]|nr:3',5'-cyclic-nucleotide phosphodiesterase [Nevskia sp.]
MRIKILGCSGGVGPGLRTTSLLVDDAILVDAGTGVGDLSLAQMSRITDVLITHSHLDHVCGLAFIADNLFGLLDRPLRVHATPETLAALREHLFNWKLWPDFSALPDAEHPIVVFHPLEPGQARAVGAMTVTPFQVLHTVPAVGYLIDSGQGVFVFTGDTYADDRLWNFLNGQPRLDRLMIDVAFPDEDAELGRLSRHFTPGLLGQELAKLRHRPKLYLTHHKPGTERAIEQECLTALAGWDYSHLKRGDIIMS